MPDWLIEGDPTTLLLLAVAGICAAAAWWKTRRRWLLLITIVAVFAIGALVILDKMFESDREQIARKLQQMAAAVAPRDLNKLTADISADFRYGEADKQAFRKFCEERIRARDVREFIIWDAQAKDVSRTRKRAEVSFQFKARTNERNALEDGFFLCRATFALDPDGQWRLLTFKVFPLTGSDQALTIPGLG